jgi:hypothetical protein
MSQRILPFFEFCVVLCEKNECLQVPVVVRGPGGVEKQLGAEHSLAAAGVLLSVYPRRADCGLFHREKLQSTSKSSNWK